MKDVTTSGWIAERMLEMDLERRRREVSNLFQVRSVLIIRTGLLVFLHFLVLKFGVSFDWKPE